MAEGIETREQNLIQRIRTSGLAQNREIMLVDEVLEIRKERRRLIAKLNEEIGLLKEMAGKWEQKFTLLDQRVGEQEREYRQQEERRRLRDQSRIEQLKEEIVRNHQNEVVSLQAEFKVQNDQMKLQYEQSLSELAAKLREVSNEQKNHDLTQAKVIANKLVKKISSELEERFNRKTQEYKETLLQIAEREKFLETSLIHEKKELETLVEKEKTMMETLHSLQSRLETGYQREKELEKKSLLLETENESLKAAVEKQEQFIEELKSSQDIALRKVDEKVRKMLDIKDKEIAQLKQQISSLTEEKVSLERVFTEIGRDLQDVRVSSRR